MIGYIIGSIPWALIIGKCFYGIDIREYGSGNLGGTNAFRTLGKVPGISVMFLDAAKAFLYMVVLNFLYKEAIPYAGLAVCLGHCFPLFANFRGGKAVACSCGYVLAISLFMEHKVLQGFVIPMTIFLIVLFTTKYMSIASMSCLVSSAIVAWIFYDNKTYAVLISLLAMFVIFMHRSNIKKLINHTEAKMSSPK